MKDRAAAVFSAVFSAAVQETAHAAAEIADVVPAAVADAIELG